ERADVGRHADIDFLHHEERILGGVAAVAGTREIDAAADTAALDSDQHRHADFLHHVEGALNVQDGGADVGANAAALMRRGRGAGADGGAAGEYGEVHTGSKMLASR